MSNRAFPTAVLAIALAACSEDDGPTGVQPSSTPATMVILSGDAQTGIVARALENPLVTRVTDARGRPVRNASVWFEVTSGGGAIVGRVSVLTDSLGLASTRWQLGTSTAVDHTARARVRARAGGDNEFEATFHATALPESPSSVAFVTSVADPIEPAASFTRTAVARAYDFFGNPVPGAVVQWAAPMAGTFDADRTVTGPDGSTENQWTVRAISGATLGAGAYWITAAILGAPLSGPPALFTQPVGESRIDAVSLASGEAHSCAVADAGEIHCWGENAFGQLGDGTRVSRPFATRVSGAESFTQVVAGTAHTCALATSGKAYCWGNNSDGQLGDGTRTSSMRPVLVEGSETFVSLTAGSSHTCGLTPSGAAYCWGGNGRGQLGDGSTGSQSVPTAVVGAARFTSLTAGAAHTCGLASDGRASCWGNDEAGQLGTTVVYGVCGSPCVTIPAPVEGKFVGLSAGLQYTCGVDADGVTSCWGGYLSGRVELPGVRFTGLVGGPADAACGLTHDGRAYCWTFIYDDYYYYYEGAQMSEPVVVGGDRLFSALELGVAQTCGRERGTPSWVVCWNGNTEPGFVLRAGQP